VYAVVQEALEIAEKARQLGVRWWDDTCLPNVEAGADEILRIAKLARALAVPAPRS